MTDADLIAAMRHYAQSSAVDFRAKSVRVQSVLRLAADRIAELSVDVDAAAALLPEFVIYEMSRSERAILSRFRDLGCIVSKEILAIGLSGGNEALKVHICHIRKKLHAFPFWIGTHRGVGYSLNQAVSLARRVETAGRKIADA